MNNWQQIAGSSKFGFRKGHFTVDAMKVVVNITATIKGCETTDVPSIPGVTEEERMVYRNRMLGLRARKDATLIALAGNLAVIVVAKHPEVGEFYGNETIHDIKSWLQMVKLYLADETTEAVLITNSEKNDTVKI